MLTACGITKVDNSKMQAEPILYSVVDSKGFELKFQHKPKRIVSMSISTDEILLDLVESERIVALTYLVDDPGISNMLEKAKTVKGRVMDTNSEAILKHKPDLIIIPDFVKLEIIQSLREMGLNVYVYKTPNSFKEIMDTILEFGAVVHEKERAEKLVSLMQDRLHLIEQKIAAVSKNSTKRVIWLRNGGANYRPESSFNDICKHAMVKNALDELNLDKPVRVNQEEIVRLNPDLFILIDWNGSQRTNELETDNPYNNDAYDNVKAIRNRAVFILPSRHLMCLSQYTVEAVKDLAEAAYGIKDIPQLSPQTP